MTRKTTLWTLLLLLPLSLCAQTLIPWRAANGLYGLANDAGQLIVPARYDNLDLLPESASFTWGRQEGKDVLVFRNGMDCPGNGLLVKPMTVLNETTEGTPADTLQDIGVFYENDQVLLVHYPTRTFQRFKNYSRQSPPEWFWYTRHKAYLPYANFIHGVYPVLDAQKKVNFVDTQLKTVFPGGWTAATVCDEKYFIVAENEHKMAVANRQGKLVSPWYRQLQPTGTPGVFILNNPRNSYSPEAPRAGLIDAAGLIRIDTQYQYLEPVSGGASIIVQRNNRSALFDTQGKILLPFDSCRGIQNTGLADHLKVQWNNGKYSLCNSRGVSYLPGQYDQVEVSYNNALKPTYYQCRNGALLWWYNADKQLPLTDSLYKIGEIQGITPARFLSYKNENGQLLLGLRDGAGRRILPEKYQAIELKNINGQPYFQLKINHQLGLADPNGKLLIPCTLDGLEIEFTEKDTIIWQKRRPNRLWSAFDITGKKLPYPDYFRPSTRQDQLWGIGLSDKGEKVFISLDGKAVPFPDYLKKAECVMLLGKENNGLGIYRKKGEALLVVNEKLQPIVPEGFTALSKFLEKKRFEQTGLLPVYTLLEGDTLPPKREEENAPPPTDVDIDRPVGTETVGSWGTGAQTPVVRSCGILDASGAWVLPPKKGVHYIPVSPYLVAELPFDEKRLQSRLMFNRIPYTLHRVRQAQKGSFQVGSTAQPYFLKGYSAMLMTYPATKSGQQAANGAYFDAYGNQLCSWEVVNGSDFLQSRNLLRLRTPEGVNKTVLTDATAKVLREMGTLRPEGYFELVPDQQGKLRAPWVLARPDENSPLTGLLDTNGNWILEPRFTGLEVLLDGKWCSYKRENGERVLLDWQGRELFSAKGKTCLVISLTNGNTLICLDTDKLSESGVSILLNPDKKIVYQVPVAFPDTKGDRTRFSSPYIRMNVRHGASAVWVRLADGKMYAD